jgi:hypothetical protein
MKSVDCAKPGYTSTCITCSTISNIPYNLIFAKKFNDSSILITISSCDYLNLSLANEYVGDVTIPTQVIKYNQFCFQAGSRPRRPLETLCMIRYCQVRVTVIDLCFNSDISI